MEAKKVKVNNIEYAVKVRSNGTLEAKVWNPFQKKQCSVYAKNTTELKRKIRDKIISNAQQTINPTNDKGEQYITKWLYTYKIKTVKRSTFDLHEIMFLRYINPIIGHKKFKEQYPINIMCEELEVSRDAYYKCLKRKNTKNRYELNHESLKPIIQKYYDLSNGTAGYRQIKEQIEYHERIIISYYMSFLIKCCIMKLPEVRKKKKNKGKYTITTKGDEKKYSYQNIAENIDIDDIYKVISTDTTEVKLEEDRKQNVSFFIDAYSTEILVSCIGKSLNNDFIEYNLNLLNNNDYKLDGVILHSDRGGMYKSGIYNTKTAEMNLIPSMSAPYTCTHNPWIETHNGQFKDFIKNNYPKNLDELQIALEQFVYYNNNIKIKNKLKTSATKYRCSHS